VDRLTESRTFGDLSQHLGREVKREEIDEFKDWHFSLKATLSAMGRYYVYVLAYPEGYLDEDDQQLPGISTNLCTERPKSFTPCGLCEGRHNSST